MHPDSLVIVRINVDLAVINGARVGVGHLGPGFTFIFTAEDAAAGMFNQRVNNVGVPAVEAHTDSTDLFHGCRVRRRRSRCLCLLLGSAKSSATTPSTAAPSAKAACAGQR